MLILFISTEIETLIQAYYLKFKKNPMNKKPT